MKRTAAMLLGVLMLLGSLNFQTFAAAELLPERTSEAEAGEYSSEVPERFEENVWGQAFAISMMCWNADTDQIRLWEPRFAWEATGWYAAWLWRSEGIDLLPQNLAQDFQRTLGVEVSIGDPNDWLGETEPRELRGVNGALYYDFAGHKQLLEEQLGLELELSSETGQQLTETVSVIRHAGNLDTYERVYELRFGRNGDPDSSFPYCVEELTVPKDRPEIDPALTFSWDLLKEQNSMEKILSLYPAVRIYSRTYNTGDETWFFLDGEVPVMITDAYGSVTGRYGGCFFELGTSSDGVMRPQIGSIEKGRDSMKDLDGFVLDYFDEPLEMRLDRIEGNLIWADAFYRGGYREKLAFDRGTLVLREAMSLTDNGEVAGITGFDYTASPPEYRFLEGWNRPLRSIDVLWENYTGGERQLRRETIEIPTDWEYLPYECRWGDYTAYTNDRYIGDYRYPGDGEGYLLFLTTVKG